MRVSCVICGISKLFPTLRAVCPASIEQLPRGLAAVAGRRVAIDGTLAVVRLAHAATRAHSRQAERDDDLLLHTLSERSAARETHSDFSAPSDSLCPAPAPDEPRTVLDWYRALLSQLLRSLLVHSIRTIVVLDDPCRRLPAKKRELERRQQGRELSEFRAQVEHDRTSRLDRLHEQLERANTLAEARDAVHAQFEPKLTVTPVELARVEQNSRIPDSTAPPVAASVAITTSRGQTAAAETEDWETLAAKSGSATPPPSIPAAMTTSRTQAAMAESEKMIIQRLLARAPDSEQRGAEPPAPLASASSAPKPSRFPTATPEPDLGGSSSPPHSEIPSVVSSQGEGPAPPLSATTVHEPPALTDEAKLAQARDEVRFLQQESELLYKQYTRRRTPPMSQLVEETLVLCKQYHVPVLRVEDGNAHLVEAEALASALVLHGWADLVLSEDSDVVIYGAPLLRLRGTKAEVVHSAHARHALFPTSPLAEDEVDEALWLDGVDTMDAFPKPLEPLEPLEPLKPQTPLANREPVPQGDESCRAKMVDFAILCGSDFCPTLPGVGPKRALEGLRAHGSIERLVDAFLLTGKPKTGIPAASGSWQKFFAQVNAARSIFLQQLDLGPWEAMLRRAQQEELPVIKDHALFLDGGEVGKWADAYAKLDVEGQTRGLAAWPPPDSDQHELT